MVCWLFLAPQLSERLKALEPNIVKRKRRVLDILRELEKETEHNLEEMKRMISEEDIEELLARLEEMKMKKRKKEKKKAQEEAVAIA